MWRRTSAGASSPSGTDRTSRVRDRIGAGRPALPVGGRAPRDGTVMVRVHHPQRAGRHAGRGTLPAGVGKGIAMAPSKSLHAVKRYDLPEAEVELKVEEVMGPAG